MRRPLPVALGDVAYALASRARRPCVGCRRTSFDPLCRVCLAGACADRRPHEVHGTQLQPLARLHHLGYYRRRPPDDRPSPLANALVRFKYGGDRAAGHALAWLFGRHAEWLPAGCDIVVPVPLHGRRLRERGFNQAAWLARALARRAGVTLEPDALVRPVDVEAQASRSAEARRRTKHGFLADKRRAEDKTVLLVDDVFTTGTTSRACARALLDAGATRVTALVLLLAEPRTGRDTPRADRRTPYP